MHGLAARPLHPMALALYGHILEEELTSPVLVMHIYKKHATLHLVQHPCMWVGIIPSFCVNYQVGGQVLAPRCPALAKVQCSSESR